MKIRCLRCRQMLDTKSAFAIRLVKRGGHVLYDVIRTRELPEDATALHMNGDPQCGRPVSGWKQHALESLGFTSSYDLSFLDNL